MTRLPALKHNTSTYIFYIVVSCIVTTSLNIAHSELINYTLTPSGFIVPLIAGIMFGYFLAKNKILSSYLNILAHTDMLTGVYNRAMFEHLLEAEILKTNRYGGTFSVIFLDIDHFKAVNDQYGHQTGDRVLSDFSHLIKKLNRLSDITARYGGEEFIIMAISSDLAATETHAERLRRAIEMHQFDTINQLTCSFGIVEFKKDVDTHKTLLKRADDALYEAKKNGRNRIETAY